MNVSRTPSCRYHDDRETTPEDRLRRASDPGIYNAPAAVTAPIRAVSYPNVSDYTQPLIRRVNENDSPSWSPVGTQVEKSEDQQPTASDQNLQAIIKLLTEQINNSPEITEHKLIENKEKKEEWNRKIVQGQQVYSGQSVMLSQLSKTIENYETNKPPGSFLTELFENIFNTTGSDKEDCIYTNFLISLLNKTKDYSCIMDIFKALGIKQAEYKNVTNPQTTIITLALSQLINLTVSDENKENVTCETLKAKPQWKNFSHFLDKFYTDVVAGENQWAHFGRGEGIKVFPESVEKYTRIISEIMQDAIIQRAKCSTFSPGCSLLNPKWNNYSEGANEQLTGERIKILVKQTIADRPVKATEGKEENYQISTNILELMESTGICQLVNTKLKDGKTNRPEPGLFLKNEITKWCCLLKLSDGFFAENKKNKPADQHIRNLLKNTEKHAYSGQLLGGIMASIHSIKSPQRLQADELHACLKMLAGSKKELKQFMNPILKKIGLKSANTIQDTILNFIRLEFKALQADGYLTGIAGTVTTQLTHALSKKTNPGRNEDINILESICRITPPVNPERTDDENKLTTVQDFFTFYQMDQSAEKTAELGHMASPEEKEQSQLLTELMTQCQANNKSLRKNFQEKTRLLESYADHLEDTCTTGGTPACKNQSALDKSRADKARIISQLTENQSEIQTDMASLSEQRTALQQAHTQFKIQILRQSNYNSLPEWTAAAFEYLNGIDALSRYYSAINNELLKPAADAETEELNEAMQKKGEMLAKIIRDLISRQCISQRLSTILSSLVTEQKADFCRSNIALQCEILSRKSSDIMEEEQHSAVFSGGNSGQDEQRKQEDSEKMLEQITTLNRAIARQEGADFTNSLLSSMLYKLLNNEEAVKLLELYGADDLLTLRNFYTDTSEVSKELFNLGDQPEPGEILMDSLAKLFSVSGPIQTYKHPTESASKPSPKTGASPPGFDPGIFQQMLGGAT